jgi:hypothetical protein
MSDMLRWMKDNEARLRQTETKEVPGAVGQSTFYAEGTWTPTYSGATTTGVTTYTAQVGYYKRIGNLVIFSLYVAWSAATGTGTAVIGLPLNVVNVTNLFFAPALWYSGITYGAGTGALALIRPSTARAELQTPTNNAASAGIAVEAAGEVVMTGSYFI